MHDAISQVSTPANTLINFRLTHAYQRQYKAFGGGAFRNDVSTKGGRVTCISQFLTKGREVA